MKNVPKASALTLVAIILLALSLTSCSSETQKQAPELVKFFAYDCLPCYQVEMNQDPALSLKMVHLSFGSPEKQALARLFYSLEVMERVSTHHKLAFRDIQQQRLIVTDSQSLMDWIQAVGLDPNAFSQAWSSPLVDQKIKQGEALAAQFNVRTTPAFLVRNSEVIQYTQDAKTTWDVVNKALGLSSETEVKNIP